MHCVERARTPDREVLPPRPRPVSPGPDRIPAPAAESVKPYQISEDGYFIPRLPSPNSCLAPEEFSELRDLLQEFRGRFNDGTRPLSASNLLKARLDTGNTPPISFPRGNYHRRCEKSCDQLSPSWTPKALASRE